ncbi:P-loop containing nucleoside triphosphate hydrolase protein [Stachybotrys elegans]|uniref:Kinesin-like protein n=1 Tax=Stachybotrys elegans TaxID=80388 RepID=A0A8K0WMZ7_9HYPO|nr:P-loop containing nucleoside triphosphate hydrolase protein [Stachybotrys elegans]
MDSAKSHNLFEVYLRLRPPPATSSSTDRILNVEQPDDDAAPSHITLNPPTDRRRAIEKFAFTQVFEEDATQLDVFHCTEIVPMIQGVLAPQGGEGTDAVVATLGVTGSGKTHTILGSRSQRGLTQLALDVLFRSIGANMLDATSLPSLLDSLQACDSSESTLATAPYYIDSMYSDGQASRANSRAATPMIGDHSIMSPPPRRNLARPSALPQSPDVSALAVPCDPSAEYVVVISMYEVHNDRIYDLLNPPKTTTKDHRRRPLLFKSTELSPDRKVVAGLRKVICTSFKEAILVLEAGLQERRVAGTGSNSVSSRSHGFFCFEVKKKTRSRRSHWSGSKLTIVDLAGSERARDAKTQGATLVEAGKINESLMYLGQCLQTQSEASSSSKPNIVPYRQCKLTELLFSNSFPTSGHNHRAQRGVMIVTADPLGDFNATSQILRYSALAREVTVPRSGSFRNHTPLSDGRTTMEIAALEIARLSDEMDHLRLDLEHQTEARMEAEAHLLSMEDRMLDMEAMIREECANEFEQRLALELARFKASMALEQERSEEHWDRKVDVLERGLDADDSHDKENVLIENLEEEVERLRRDNAILKRELASRSPSKRKPLEERDDFAAPTRGEVSNLGRKLERMRVSNEAPRSGASPKKVRKLATKRWDDLDG